MMFCRKILLWVLGADSWAIRMSCLNVRMRALP